MTNRTPSRHTAVRTLALALCVLAVAGCTGGNSSSAQPTAGAPSANAPLPASESAVATAAPPTPTRNLPTPAPTITAGPTATPFPLAAGWWDGAVCYEIFVRSFYDSNGDGIGDLNGIAQKLDYINDGNPKTGSDLGANCIWLMPIMESPSYHGYDTTDYYAVNHEYGSNDDFKALVAEAHKRGITIILDLVLNHTSNQSRWFQQAASDPASPYRDWYLWSKDKPGYKNPWGDDPQQVSLFGQIHDVFACRSYRNLFLTQHKCWHAFMKRLLHQEDPPEKVTPFEGDDPWRQSSARNEYYYGIFSHSQPDLNYRNPAVTAEARKISAFWLNDMGADGFRLDAIKHLIENGQNQQNTVETHAWLRDYRTFLQQTKPGAFTVGEIFGDPPATLRTYYPDQLDDYFEFNIAQNIVAAASGGIAPPFMSAVTTAEAVLPYDRWAPFLTNHDQNRVMTTLGNDMGKARIAATALLTLPGLPFVYYGEEIGMTGQKPDEQIRTPMQWAADSATAGFSTGKPWETPQKDTPAVNVAAQDGDAGSLLNLYRALIQLHTSNNALGSGAFVPLRTSNGAVAAFLRQTAGETVLVVLNFSKVAANDVTLDLAKSTLGAGAYQLVPLLGEQASAPLTVGGDGSIASSMPWPSFAPQTGYIATLQR